MGCYTGTSGSLLYVWQSELFGLLCCLWRVFHKGFMQIFFDSEQAVLPVGLLLQHM